MADDRPRLDASYQVALWLAGCFEFAHQIYLADESCPRPGITFDEFCLEFGPFARRYDGDAELRPMPGDFVTLGPNFTGAYWDYPRRAGGIINGWVGHESDEYLVTFGAQEGGAFRGPSHSFLGPRAGVFVDCSGGPGFKIPARELKAGLSKYAHYWRWIDVPRADGGERYRLLVPGWVWDVKITS